MASTCIVRLISSKDHAMNKEELLKTIRQTGTDRYDTKRKPIFDGFYSQHKIDFFGTVVERDKLDSAVSKLKVEFATKTKADRGRSVQPDIMLIYKTQECEMVPNVYADVAESDCFCFKSTPLKALEEVKEI